MPVVGYRGIQLIVPENDSEFAGYFEAARQHRLVMKKCSACQLMRYPPGSGCPWCMSLDWTWQEVSGKGTIYTYEIIVHAIQPGFRAIAPYPWWSSNSTSSGACPPSTTACASWRT